MTIGYSYMEGIGYCYSDQNGVFQHKKAMTKVLDLEKFLYELKK
nr:hypothetical protein [uncultured Peptostreptococcus sp.]